LVSDFGGRVMDDEKIENLKETKRKDSLNMIVS
jgi:hypothetical protein